MDGRPQGAAMRNKTITPFIYLFAIILTISIACTMPSNAPTTPEILPTEPELLTVPEPTEPPFSAESNLPTLPPITHVDIPLSAVGMGANVYDVESSGTAAEKRAPYGDSYDIYRMERPFTQDMTYIPDMDIDTFNVGIEGGWVYVSVEIIGSDPNNPIGIHYGVELDTDRDGFGDYIIWASPPYLPEWSTEGVQVFVDQNHDTGGISIDRSDAPINGDGYETLLFNSGIGDDPDLAWVRFLAGQQAIVQFAFKESLAGSAFLLGVLSDAGLKDVGRMYYNDRFTEPEAGSPEKSEEYYPLKELYAFDNTCREAFNFIASGLEPMLCPTEPPPTTVPNQPHTPGPTEPTGCQPPPGGCPYGWAGEPYCYCIPG